MDLKSILNISLADAAKIKGKVLSEKIGVNLKYVGEFNFKRLGRVLLWAEQNNPDGDKRLFCEDDNVNQYEVIADPKDKNDEMEILDCILLSNDTKYRSSSSNLRK
jgi:hypothetical protein